MMKKTLCMLDTPQYNSTKNEFKENLGALYGAVTTITV